MLSDRRLFHRASSSVPQIVIWFSGLRGAIAVALSLQVMGPERDMIVATTMVSHERRGRWGEGGKERSTAGEE